MIENKGSREKVDAFEWESKDESSYVLREQKDRSNGLDTSRVIHEDFEFLDLRHDSPVDLRSTKQVFGIL